MDKERFEALLQLFKVLADETRLRIVGMVAEQPCAVDELASRLNLKAPTVSHHLQRLKEAGLVSMQREQNSHLYRLVPGSLPALSKALQNLEQVTAPEAEQAAEAWEDKVLRTFLVNDRLVSIPAMRKKRAVIMRWLAERFAHGQDYPEKELNAVLARYHEDVATLRRELIAFGLFERARQVYRRKEESQ